MLDKEINGAAIASMAGAGTSVNAENNWWGCNAGPNQVGCDTTAGTLDANPWLVLRATTSDVAIESGGDTGTVTGSLRTNSDGDSFGAPAFPSTPLAFATTLGTLSATPVNTAAGAGATTLTSGSTSGTATVSVSLDNATASVPVTVRAAPPVPPSLDRDGDGLVNDKDCAPDDGARPATNGADADCDGTVDPAPVTPSLDRDGDGLVNDKDCAPDDGARPATNGADANCDGTIDPLPVTPQQARDTCKPTIGSDFLVCTARTNLVKALAGNDTVEGAAGNDRLSGDDGDDRLLGAAGNDSLYGGAGDDTLEGRAGRDKLKGSAGDDTLLGGDDQDSLNGGSGADVLRGGAGNDKITARDKKANDVVDCGAGKDVAYVDGGDQVSKNCETVKVRRSTKR